MVLFRFGTGSRVESTCMTKGIYYAAKIEVWHKDAKTGRETKLMEKVYRVEGWMR